MIETESQVCSTAQRPSSLSNPAVTPRKPQKPSALALYRPILLGIALFLLVNAGITWMLTATPLHTRINLRYENHLPAKLQLLQGVNPSQLDVLFLGTSQTHNGFATPAFEGEGGLQSFNMGLPGNTYDAMLGYLQSHLKTHGKPKLLLLELSSTIQIDQNPHFFSAAMIYRSLLNEDPRQILPILTDPALDENVRRELSGAMVSGLYQFRHLFSPVNILTKVTEKAERRLLGSPTPRAGVLSKPFPSAWTAKGWSPKPSSELMHTEEGLETILAEAQAFYLDALPPVNFQHLKALLSFCQENEIPVALVTWPNHPAFVQQFQESRHYQPFMNGVQEIVQQHQVPWIDLQTVPPPPMKDVYSDPRHLTPEGARYYSRHLRRLMLKDVAIRRHIEPVAAAP
jgi:hypothetical protein